MTAIARGSTEGIGARFRALGASTRARYTRAVGDNPLLFWLTIVGAVLFPAGLIVILLGWDGASHTSRAWEQTSYLISGGLFGLGLVLTGGFIYFGTWLARLLTEQRTTADRLAMLLERLESSDQQSLGDLVPRQATAASTGSLVATPTGTMLHRPDCSVVAGREDIRVVSADDDLKPCRLCDPLGAS